MAGFALARAIRQVYPDLPILLLTAVNQEFPLGFSGNEIRPPGLPFSDFLDKPVEFGILVDHLNKLLDAPRSP
jgi:CheY-like chemotaxis protein